jgi:hypothetical protein
MVRMRPCIVVGLVIIASGPAYAMTSSSTSAGSMSIAKGSASTIKVAPKSDSKVAHEQSSEAELSCFEQCRRSECILAAECQDEKAWAEAVKQIRDERYYAKTDRLGQNLLHLAVQHNFMLAAKAFVQAGAEIDARDYAGMTAFLWAVRARNYGIVGYLLACGAARNARDNRGWSAAHYAAQNGDARMLDWLRFRRVNLNLESKPDENILAVRALLVSPTCGALTPLRLAQKLQGAVETRDERARYHKIIKMLS